MPGDARASVVPRKEVVPAKMSFRERERDRVAALFKVVDVDGSGTIDAEELRPLLARLGWRGKIADVLVKVDKDQSGAVDFDELIKWWLDGGGRKKRWFFGGEAAAKDDTLELRRDAFRLLEADARYQAESVARDEFRRQFPPRQSCQVCGLALRDAESALKHQEREALTDHGRWRRNHAAALRRRALLERARERVRKESGKFLFPRLFVFDSRVSHLVELQTYDIPDIERGRPTGVLNLRTGAAYCVGDGSSCGFDWTKDEDGEVWLRVLWPSHATDGGGSTVVNITLDTLHDEVSQAATLTTQKTRRRFVWVRNRSKEFAKGRKAVLRQLKSGPSTDESIQNLPRRRRWWQHTLKGKRNIVAAKEEREAEERKRLLGDEIAYMCSLRSLRTGTDVILWNEGVRYRTAPSLPTLFRLKIRALPELHAAVLGEMECGDSILVFGKSGDWLVGAFGDRDNVWFLERSRRRVFLVCEESDSS